MFAGFYTLALQKKVNVPVTFTPIDEAVVNNVWKVNGSIESTDLIFVKTFTTPGSYSVSHECAATCGTACIPYTEEIEIMAESPSESSWLFVAGILVAASIVLKKKENQRG